MSSRIPNGFLRLSVPVLSKIAPRLAVIGSGPGAFYTAKYIMRQLDSARIDMFERLPEPFGLVNYGVAPDHPEVKNVRNEFRAVAHEYHDRFRLFAEAEPKLSSLQQHYDGIVVATGAQDAHRLGLPGSEQVRRGILSARDFVSWYNGHPDFAAVTSMLPPAEETEKVVVIGHGNVALDVARVLSKPVGEFESTEISREALQWLSKRPPNSGKVGVLRRLSYGMLLSQVSVVGRRGFPEAKFTNKELREITRIDGVTARAYESELIGKQDWHLDRAKK
ncbi:adrenodoxin reductase, putative, partial [Perkinsus marinus ATCC 50983]